MNTRSMTIKELKDEIDALKAEHKKFRQEIFSSYEFECDEEEVEESFKALKAENEALKEENEKLKAEVSRDEEDLLDENAQLEQTLEEQRVEIEELTEANDNAEKYISELKEQLQRRDEDYQLLKHEKQGAVKDMITAIDRRATAELRLKTLKSMVREIEDDNSKLTDQCNKHAAQLNKEYDEHRALSRKIEDLKEELDKLKEPKHYHPSE